MQLSPAQKNIINNSVNLCTFAVRWGFVPFVVYLGFRKGGDTLPTGQPAELTIGSLFWS